MSYRAAYNKVAEIALAERRKTFANVSAFLDVKRESGAARLTAQRVRPAMSRILTATVLIPVSLSEKDEA